MEINIALVKELREISGAGVMDCKKALAETKGNLEKALEYLRERGLKVALKKQDREAKEGLVEAYIHPGGRIGVLVEVNCETDFVARTPEFQTLAKDLTLHIAAANPLYPSRNLIPQEVLEKEKKIYRTQAVMEKKPEKIIDKYVEGKLEKYFGEVCLLDQPFVKDQSITIKDLLQQHIALVGENLSIKRFARFQLNEGSKNAPQI